MQEAYVGHQADIVSCSYHSTTLVSKLYGSESGQTYGFSVPMTEIQQAQPKIKFWA
jgi:hypothetical protein